MDLIWAPHVDPDFDFADFPSEARVLDIGCGDGDQLRAAKARGCDVVGLEPTIAAEEVELESGLRVVRGTAEALPFFRAEFDGIICKVVTPYTDDRRCIAEIARVLKPGGVALFCHHGAGYYLKYLLTPPHWKNRVYGLRALVNTWVYRLTGRRLPMPIGDTVYQTRTALRRYYAESGLSLERDQPTPGFFGFPVFVYQVVRRQASPTTANVDHRR